MAKEIIDLDIVRNWYMQVWEDFVDVDANYKSWEEKRRELLIYLNFLEPILKNASVDIEELKQGLELTTKAEAEDVEQKTLPDVIYEILQESGRPMHYREILNAVNSTGVIVRGKDPSNTVIAYIGRYKSRFTKAPEIGRGYYKLKEWQKGE